MKDVTEQDVKEEFDKLEQEEAKPEVSSDLKDKQGAPSPGDVKTVTPGKQEKSQAVPYERFKEVQEKASKVDEFDSFLKENEGKVRRNPVTGKLEFVQETKSAETKDPFELTDDDMMAFDEQQLKVIDKILHRRERELVSRSEQAKVHKEESDKWWSRAQEKYPEIKDQNSELYKKADKILREKYVVWDKSGRSFYIPPMAHFHAVRDARDELDEQATTEKQAEQEEKKNKPQTEIVSKGSKEPAKSKTKTDTSKMSEAEMDAVMKEEFEKNIEAL